MLGGHRGVVVIVLANLRYRLQTVESCEEKRRNREVNYL